MGLTLRGLAADPALSLTMLVDGADADRPITWVHVSELDDPAPFLSGGELLLSTGLQLTARVNAAGYVGKLREAGVVGLGLGIGLSHERVPTELVRAASPVGLTVLEVPRRTPFIAISRAVSRALAAEEYAAVTRTFTAQQELTRAARSAAGPDALVRLLSRQVDGWVTLLDAAGASVAVHPAAAGSIVPALREDVSRLRGHRGAVGSSFSVGDDAVSLQPVGRGELGFLAVGKASALSPSERHLMNAAVLLLTLRLQQATPGRDQLAALRAGLFELALAGFVERAKAIGRRAGSPFPDDPVVVLVAQAAPVAGGMKIPALADAFIAVDDRFLIAIAQAAATAAVVDELVAAGCTVGVSNDVVSAELMDGRRQAARALEEALRCGMSAVRFSAVGAPRIPSLLDPTRATTFAQSLLGPLQDHDLTGRGELVRSLRVWLAHHGQWDPSAAALGVHRHTLRRRIGVVARLLEADLDSPTVRSELWLALEILGF